MNPTLLENLISIIGALLVVGGVGGAAWLTANELRSTGCYGLPTALIRPDVDGTAVPRPLPCPTRTN